MKAPSARNIAAAAASVAGARAMGISTAASKAAPALLAEAHAWLRAEIDGAQFERRWQEVSAAAADLAAALGVPSLNEEMDASRRSTVVADKVAADLANLRAQEAAQAERAKAAAWQAARERTFAEFGDLRDERGVPVAIVERRVEITLRGEYGRNMPGYCSQGLASVIADDGRLSDVGTVVVAADRDSVEYAVVATPRGIEAVASRSFEGTSATSQWLPTTLAGRLYGSDMGAEMAFDDAFAARSAERKAAKAASTKPAAAPVGAMASAFAALRR